MTIYILLTTPATDAGPFNLYSDVDGFVSPFSINVSKATLLGGYSVVVPNGTTIVRIISVGDCTNFIEVSVGGGPIPTTTTTSSTTANPFLNAWYYGKYNSPGGVVPIPNENDIDISTGTVVTNVDPSGPISIPFNSATDDFLWFAIPQSANGKTNWFVTTLNQGLIGGPANQFGNLFPDPIQTIYLGVPIYLYISTGRTNVVQMTMSGSIVVTTTTSTTLPLSLILEFNNISNADLLVGDASDVNDWNTFFDLPSYGNPFTSVQISGNYVRLIGGSNIIMYASLFRSNNDLLSVDDQAACIIECESDVFEFCEQLLNVNLPGVVTVANDVFRYCERLISANLPALVTAGNDLFENCTDLTTVNLPLLTTVSFSAFSNCINLVSVNLPSLTTASSDLFQGCTSLTTVNLPLLATVSFGTFINCTNLTTVSLPSLVTESGDLFFNCTNLTSVNLPILNLAGSSSFENCTSLMNISLPMLTTTGSDFFRGCVSLTNISIPTCTDLGGSVTNSAVFFDILGNNITLTVSSFLMTCDGGNPDGDIQYLQANNTVTIITV